MKTIVITLIFILAATQALAMPATTKGGEIACISKAWYQDMVSFVAAQDKDSFGAYIDSQKCIVIKKGLKVTVIESPGMFGGNVGYVFKGVKFWGARESLDYGY